jgi:hypothetical protein
VAGVWGTRRRKGACVAGGWERRLTRRPRCFKHDILHCLAEMIATLLVKILCQGNRCL